MQNVFLYGLVVGRLESYRDANLPVIRLRNYVV